MIHVVIEYFRDPNDDFFNDYSVINNQSFPASGQKLVQVHFVNAYDGSRDQYNSTALLREEVYSFHNLTTSYTYTASYKDSKAYHYMADGQPARVDYEYGDLQGIHSFEPQYNDLRIPVGKNYIHPSNSQYNFEWRTELDNFARPKKNLTAHQGVQTQTGEQYFDLFGNLLMKGIGSTGNASDPHFDYIVFKKDIREQVVNQSTKNLRIGLTYNSIGNITKQTWSSEHFDPTTGTPVNANVYEYYYDNMNRLIGADYKSGTYDQNPFLYFDAISANLPNDFYCGVNEVVMLQLLDPIFSELKGNIKNGHKPEHSRKTINSLNIFKAEYQKNNVSYATMTETEKDVLLNKYIDKSIKTKTDPLAYEEYMALKNNDIEHLELLKQKPVTPGQLKYVKTLVQSMALNELEHCQPNLNATVYGYLPTFPNPTSVNNVTPYDAAYWYTRNGNITDLNRNDDVGVKTQQDYAYANTDDNQLTDVTWNVPGDPAETHSYQYDANGNLLNDSRNGVSSIVYTPINDMPQQIQNTSGQKAYRYDANTSRTAKINGKTDIEYYMDGVVLDAYGNVKSYQTADGYAVPHLLQGGNMAMDYFYYITDWLGTVREVIDAQGNVLNAADHYPYGLRMPGRHFVTDGEGNRYQFTGHEFDGETGYEYHGARYYNRELGKYMNVDPVIKYHESPYAHAANNPVMYIDVNGMDTMLVQIHDVEVTLSNGEKAIVQETYVDKISNEGDDLIVYYAFFDKDGNLNNYFGQRGFIDNSPEEMVFTKMVDYWYEFKDGAGNYRIEQGQGKKPFWEVSQITPNMNPHGEKVWVYFDAPRYSDGSTTARIPNMLVSVNIDFQPPAHTSWDKLVNSKQSETLLKYLAQTKGTTTNPIYIVGYHSFHTGRRDDGTGGITDAENDELARKRMESTTNYMSTKYPNYANDIISSYSTFNFYSARRAIVTTATGYSGESMARKRQGWSTLNR